MIKKLTVKQERFCQEYVKNGGNATKAYRDCYDCEGSNENTLNRRGCELTSNSNITARIEELKELELKRSQVTIDRTIAEYGKIAFGDIIQIFNADGSLKPLDEIDPDARALISGIEVTEKIDEEGNIIRTKKIKLSDRKGALDSISKVLEIFTSKTKVEHTGKDGAPLLDNRELTYEELIKFAEDRGLPTKIFLR